MLIQQGDVLIQSCLIPNSPKPVKSRRIVLAEGETTGHAHVINDIESVIHFESNGTMYLRVLREATAIHEEHAEVVIPPGDYSVRKVREYDHFLEEAKFVKD